MVRAVLWAAVSLLIIVIPASAAEQTLGQLRNAHGPCFLADQPRYELFARGNCRCPNGRCVVVECSAEVGGSVEATKGALRLRLEAIARAEGGQLIGELQFTLRSK